MIASDLGFAEGLRWHDGRLWFSDFLRQHVVSITLEGADRRVEVSLDDRPSGLGWLPDGRLLIVSMRRRAVLVRDDGGELSVHGDLADLAASDANDMVVAADGTAYVGNFGSNLLAGEPIAAATLAMVRPDGTVTAAAEGLIFPNGSVITAAGTLLIVGETLASRYTAFPVGPDGRLGPGRLWANVPGRSPDGCSLDAEGGIWFANAARPEVARVVEGGVVTDTIETPEPAYACALAGEDGRRLVIATSPAPPMNDLAPGGGRLWTTSVEIPHAGRP